MLRIVPLYQVIRKNCTRSFKKLKDGDQISICRIITENDVRNFAELTNDFNPVHFDPKESIVHGALLNGLVSSVIGTKLPGPGTIVAEQFLKFPNPCFIGESIEITVRIVSARKIIKCEYICIANKEKVVLKGEAKLIVKVLQNKMT